MWRIGDVGGLRMELYCLREESIFIKKKIKIDLLDVAPFLEFIDSKCLKSIIPCCPGV